MYPSILLLSRVEARYGRNQTEESELLSSTKQDSAKIPSPYPKVNLWEHMKDFG